LHWNFHRSITMISRQIKMLLPIVDHNTALCYGACCDFVNILVFIKLGGCVKSMHVAFDYLTSDIYG